MAGGPSTMFLFSTVIVAQSSWRRWVSATASRRVREVACKSPAIGGDRRLDSHVVMFPFESIASLSRAECAAGVYPFSLAPGPFTASLRNTGECCTRFPPIRSHAAMQYVIDNEQARTIRSFASGGARAGFQYVNEVSGSIEPYGAMPLLAIGNTLNANGLVTSAPKFWGNSCGVRGRSRIRRVEEGRLSCAAFRSTRAAACATVWSTGDSAAAAAPTTASAVKTKREAVMESPCGGVYQSLLAFFGGVAAFSAFLGGGAADFGGGASSALSIPSNSPRRSSLIGFGGSSTATPAR